MRFKGHLELLDPGGKVGLVTVRALVAGHLPALRILPVQVQTIKVILLQEFYSMLNEGCT